MTGGEGEFVFPLLDAQLIDGLVGQATRGYLVATMTHASRGIS